jgi:hypothetical protein
MPSYRLTLVASGSKRFTAREELMRRLRVIVAVLLLWAYSLSGTDSERSRSLRLLPPSGYFGSTTCLYTRRP